MLEGVVPPLQPTIPDPPAYSEKPATLTTDRPADLFFWTAGRQCLQGEYFSGTVADVYAMEYSSSCASEVILLAFFFRLALDLPLFS
jgi:hypothetical protein